MKEIRISEEVRNAAPNLRILQIEAEVDNAPTRDELWKAMEKAAADFAESTTIDRIKERPAIKATREAYKALGKDPNRYRPSAEALCRRIVNGKGLYRLTTLVDLINLISVETGHSIGGFDADKIEGTVLTLHDGVAGESFCGIGRGPLNIEHLPVYRDSKGGIGTPTSDEERTKLTEETKKLLMIVNMYCGSTDDDAEKLYKRISEYLTKYASAKAIEGRII